MWYKYRIQKLNGKWALLEKSFNDYDKTVSYNVIFSNSLKSKVKKVGMDGIDSKDMSDSDFVFPSDYDFKNSPRIPS